MFCKNIETKNEEEAGLKKTFRDQNWKSHTHALLICECFFERVGIIILFAFCPFLLRETARKLARIFRLVLFFVVLKAPLDAIFAITLS